MVDIDALKQCFNESGMTMTAFAKKSGIERGTLYNRFDGVGEFTASEIEGIAKALKLTVRERNNIFFAH